MSLLADLKPTAVFKYFEELSAIPRGSRDTKRASDYCVDFAKEHNLEFYQDHLNNVIIIKEASKGYENAPSVILQGHLDMVCEKKPGSSHDFSTTGIELMLEGDFIFGKDTTLGGDDGIAVAYILAILEDNSIEHPRLEAVFTVDEEIGMEGALGIDISMLRGTRMLNIDSEEEGIFLSSCAGGLRANCILPVEYRKQFGLHYQVTLQGLQGGHSGTEIDKNHKNATKLMARFLHYMGSRVPFGIIDLTGGSKDNAIPRETTAELLVEETDGELVEECIREFDTIIKAELKTAEPGVSLEFQALGGSLQKILTPKYKELVVFMLMNVPNGIQSMSADIPGLVETSLNLGIMKLTKEELILGFAVRSSLKTAKEALSDKLRYLTEFLGGEYSTSGNYPAWEYKRDSDLRKLMIEIYEKQYGSKPVVQALHAGLECGILSEKKPDLDIVSFGPDIFDIHTTEERLSISSVQRVWEFLLQVLKNCNS